MNGGSYRGHPVRPSLTAALEAALFHPAGLAMAWERAEGAQSRPGPTKP